MSSSPLRRLLGALFCLLVLVQPSVATWSIVVVDTATGEVCVASATCLANFDLKKGVPVLRVGHGGAAAQSFVDTTGKNRQLIWDELALGVGPWTILAHLDAQDNQHQTRQYGIVNFDHNPASWTGGQAGIAKKSIAGKVGTLRYAIQGNVLTSPQVIFDAEAALLATAGDLSQRVMAGMEAARALGGDGRCSCSVVAPTSCGAPPAHFAKSAHVGFIALARHGDVDGICNANAGCANGSYFLDLNIIGAPADLDPVLQLQGLYAAWRANLAGHPDGVLSTASAAAAALPADGVTQTSVHVELLDLDGGAVTSGPTVTLVPTSATPLASAGPAVQNPDGSFDFTVTAGTVAGTESFDVVVTDGVVQTMLYPPVQLRLDPPAPLHAGFDELSVAAGGSVPFTLDLGPAAAGAVYLVLGSDTGTDPGLPLGFQTLPLNWGGLLEYTLLAPGPPVLPGSLGVLDGSGRASAALVAGPGQLAPLLGVHTDWAAVGLSVPEAISNAVGLDIVP